MSAKDQVILVEHYERADRYHIPYVLGLFKYYNDKSLRHVYQHYVDVANDKAKRAAGRGFERSQYSEEQRTFQIWYSDDVQITARILGIDCVTTLPLAPFEPRSPEEAASFPTGNDVDFGTSME